MKLICGGFILMKKMTNDKCWLVPKVEGVNHDLPSLIGILPRFSFKYDTKEILYVLGNDIPLGVLNKIREEVLVYTDDTRNIEGVSKLVEYLKLNNVPFTYSQPIDKAIENIRIEMENNSAEMRQKTEEHRDEESRQLSQIRKLEKLL